MIYSVDYFTILRKIEWQTLDIQSTQQLSVFFDIYTINEYLILIDLII